MAQPVARRLAEELPHGDERQVLKICSAFSGQRSPEHLQLARPVMRRGTCLDAHKAGRQLFEEREYVDTMNLKNRFCDVEADHRDCLHDELLRLLVASWATDSEALARPVGGVVHSIRSGTYYYRTRVVPHSREMLKKASFLSKPYGEISDVLFRVSEQIAAQ